MKNNNYQICTKCGQSKPICSFYFLKRKNVFSEDCTQCRYNKIEKCKKWYSNNKEKAKAYRTQYYKKNQEKILIDHRNKYLEDKEKILSRLRQYYINNKDIIAKKNYVKVINMSSHYIAHLLGLSVYDCPKELIELKKAHLSLTRELKN